MINGNVFFDVINVNERYNVVDKNDNFLGLISYIDNFEEGPKTGWMFNGLEWFSEMNGQDKNKTIYFQGWKYEQVIEKIKQLIEKYINQFIKEE
jgi:hypothetical protein